MFVVSPEMASWEVGSRWLMELFVLVMAFSDVEGVCRVVLGFPDQIWFGFDEARSLTVTGKRKGCYVVVLIF